MTASEFYGGLFVGAASGGNGGAPIVSSSGGAIFARVANPATVEIIPAPPTGYLNIATIEAHNADAALTLSFRINDADGVVGGPGVAALAAGADAFPILAATPGLLMSALTAVVSGGTAGTPLEFRGNYIQVPKPNGLVVGTVVLTSTFQTVPNVVPSTGINLPFKLAPFAPTTELGSMVVNGDTATAVLNVRLTRGALVFQWSVNLGTAFGGRTASTGFPALLPNDLLEVKVAAPPAVAGSIVARYTFLPVPLAA